MRPELIGARGDPDVDIAGAQSLHLLGGDHFPHVDFAIRTKPTDLT
jgi:hypothetical protein